MWRAPSLRVWRNGRRRDDSGPSHERTARAGANDRTTRTGRARASWVQNLLLEAVHDQRSDWRRECDELEWAYERWRECAPGTRAQAFAVYRAALDREERACAIYRALLAELDSRFMGADGSGRSHSDVPASAARS